jgi:nucleotidyltransferase substrate binding protein (TIGR01987 family)
MKDYLLYQGITDITGSRDAIRQAFNSGLISNGEDWMQMIDDRIRTVHTYNEEAAGSVRQHIAGMYAELFEQFYHRMQEYL